MSEQIDLSLLKAEQYALNSERRRALVVGVDEAPLSGKPSLKHAVDDARSIATALREEYCGFQLLMEPLLNEQATSANVKRAVLNLKRGRGDNDFLLFYFSGHGLVWESEGGSDNVYLVTHDFSREDVNDDPNLHVSFKWLREMLYEQTKAGEVVIILDCCYAGNMSGTAPDPYVEDLKERLFRYFDTPGAKSGAKMNGLRQTLAATGYNMTALESDNGHGRMTGLILLALEGKAEQAREDDGRITIYTLHSYLQNEMPVDRPPSFSGGSAGRSGLLAYYPELRHKQTVGQQLTTGLTVLSMDYAARIQNFFTEYLGTPERPVPFGGRQEDMTSLNSWLDNPKTPPYLLLAAPAGRGKSALLVRWIQPLLNRNDLAVVFLPISIRFRTNLAGVTFAALTARLAFLHGEKVTATPDTPLEVWRGLMTDYLTRPLPDGRRLLLVLDGVDEAADWEVGPDLFPLDPPEGLQIIVSARYLAGDANAKPWLRRLGWYRPKLARPLDLNPLTPKGVADVLQHMGFPLDRLGARVDIVNELYRLSMGDPLLVRLYVDDLWERGETAARLQPEELREIRPGLEGYFDRWWEDQRRLWGSQIPLREPAVQMLLSLLACALGPLSQEDMLRLASPNVGLSSWTLEENLYPLKRFVVGDGRRQGYVFSHPRLSAYFYEERLTVQDRRALESRFLDWGKETLTALNEGSISPDQVSPYIVQYYGAHLERANRGPQEFLALVSHGWKLAWEKLEGTHAGFLNDTGKAWRVLEGEDAAALKIGSHLAPYIGDEVRCALCQASINSLAKNIPPAFLLRIVEKGIWNSAQGLAYARYIPDLEERAQVLVKLMPFLPDFLKEGVTQEAIEAARIVASPESRVRTLVTLRPHLPDTLKDQILNEALEIAGAIVDQESRVRTFIELLPHLTGDLKVEVTREALKILRADTVDEPSMYLMMLAPHLPDILLQEMLATVWMVDDDEEEALVLIALAPKLPAPLLQFALELVLAEADDSEFLTAISPKLIPYLPEKSRETVLQKALEFVRRTTSEELSLALSTLIPYLPGIVKEEVIEDALDIVRTTDGEVTQILVLVALAPYLSQTQLWEAVEIVRTIEDETNRALLLAALVPLLPDMFKEQGLQEAVQAAQMIREKDIWTQVLTVLVPHLSEKLLREALEAAQTIRDTAYQLQTQLALASHLPEALLRDVLDEARTIREKEPRIQVLAALVPHLSKTQQEEVVQEILEATRSIGEKETRFWLLSSLLPSLPEAYREEVVQEVLPAVQAIKEKALRVEILVVLFPYLSETLQGDVLQEIWKVATALDEEPTSPISTTQITQVRLQVLTALLPYLPEALKHEALQEALAAIRMIKEQDERAKALVRLLPYLPKTMNNELLQETLKKIRTLEGSELRQVLEILAPYLSEQLIQEILEEVYGSKDVTDQAEALIPLVPYLSMMQKREVLSLALRLEQKIFQAQATTLAKEQTEALTKAIPRLPESFKEKLVLEALQAAKRIEEKEDRVTVLLDLLPHLSEQQRTQVVQEILQVVRTMRMQVDLVRELVDLLPYLSEQQRVEVVQKVLLAARTYYMPMIAIELIASVPYLSQQQRDEVVQEALLGAEKIEDNRERAEIYTQLVPYLPSQQQDEVIQQALQVTREALLTAQEDYNQITDQFFTCTSFIRKLLPYLTEQQRHEVVQQTLQVVQTVKMSARIVQGLLILLPHLSESLQKEVMLEVLQRIRSSELAIEERATILVQLMPYLPSQQQQEAIQEALGVLLEIQPDLSQLEVKPDQVQPDPYPSWVYPDRVWNQTVAYITILVKLLPYLTEQQQKEDVQKILQFAQAMEMQVDFISALPELLPYLTELQQAKVVLRFLQAARRIDDKERRDETVAILIPYLPQQQQDEVVQQILLDAQKIQVYPYGLQDQALVCIQLLIALVPHLPEEQQKEIVLHILQIAETMEMQADAEQRQIDLLPYLPEQQQKEVVLQILQAFRLPGIGAEQAGILVRLMPYLPSYQQQEVVQEVLRASKSIEDELERARTLMQLVPYLPSHQQQEVVLQLLQTAREFQIYPYPSFENRVLAYSGLLVELLPHLSISQQLELVQKILQIVQTKGTQESLVEGLPELLSHLPEQQQEEIVLQLLLAIRELDSELQRTKIAVKLVPYLSQQQQLEVVQEVLQAVRTLRKYHRARIFGGARACVGVLTMLVRHLSGPLLQQALEAARRLESTFASAEALMELVPYLPETQKQAVAQEILDLIWGKDWQERQHYYYSPSSASDQIPIEVGLLPYLSEQQRVKVLQIILEAGSWIEDEAPSEILVKLVPYLPEPLKDEAIQKLLAMLKVVEEENSDAEMAAVVSLFPFLSNPLLEEILKEEVSTTRKSSKIPALIGLLPHLSVEQKEQMMREALEALRTLERIEDKAQILTELVPHLTKLPTTALYAFWRETLHILAHNTRKDLLVNLTSLVPVTLLQGGTEGAVATSRAILEVGNWWS